MFALSRIAYCLKIIVISCMLFISSQHIAFGQISTSEEVQKLNILSTLKGHMARLGTLMNVLFRDVDDAERQVLVLKTIKEMKLLLGNVRIKFIPRKVEALPDVDEKASATEGFRMCVNRALSALQEMTMHVENANYDEARQALYKLDGIRLKCHGKYAG